MRPVTRPAGGLVSAVRPGAIAEEMGIEPGDRIVSINGHRLRDVIDYQFYRADEQLTLVVERSGLEHTLEIDRDYDEELGLEFCEPLFDGLVECQNRCPFCFVQQMPKGMRRTLYIRDDDYRYSFLLGNYVTLTNLGDKDWRRIGEQRLTPLYVSIHATDLNVRRRVLGNPTAPDIVEQIERLGSMGIDVHGQVVISPGVNDGPELQRTIAESLALWPTIQTLAVVPVGITRFHRSRIRTLDPSDASSALDTVQAISSRARGRTGGTWLYPSDELYLLAGRPIPDSSHYDSEAQWENGVGMVRALLDDWTSLQGGLKQRVGATPITLVCGTLVAPILDPMAKDLGRRLGADVRVVPVPNAFFGDTVTVSGLLTAVDVLSRLSNVRPLGHVYLPRAMFDAAGYLTLDDVSLDDVRSRLGAPVSLVESMSQVVAALECDKDVLE